MLESQQNQRILDTEEKFLKYLKGLEDVDNLSKIVTVDKEQLNKLKELKSEIKKLDKELSKDYANSRSFKVFFFGGMLSSSISAFLGISAALGLVNPFLGVGFFVAGAALLATAFIQSFVKRTWQKFSISRKEKEIKNIGKEIYKTIEKTREKDKEVKNQQSQLQQESKVVIEKNQENTTVRSQEISKSLQQQQQLTIN